MYMASYSTRHAPLVVLLYSELDSFTDDGPRYCIITSDATVNRSLIHRHRTQNNTRHSAGVAVQEERKLTKLTHFAFLVAFLSLARC